MFQASRTLTAPALSPALIRRRKPLLLAPPAGYALTMPVDALEEAQPVWPRWREDMRFFAGCYAAGLIFFFIMLS